MAGKPQGAVLLADDEPVLVRLVARVLRGSGYRVRTAATVEEASVALEAAKPPDAAVLDATLSSRLAEGLRCRLLGSCARPGIVLMSGAELEPATARLLARGRGRFLAKPFEPSQLLRAVEEVMAAARAARP